MPTIIERPLPPSESEPHAWHRHPCVVTPELILTGDLNGDPLRAQAQLATWVALGVTHIIDVRGEACDETFVAYHAPEITYIWLGTHDNGRGQADEWFADGVDAALAALADPDAKVLVHCHMGINRGPSMGFAILCALGWDPIHALETIRAARPIAGVIYADEAIDWWLRRQGGSASEVAAGRSVVRQWLNDDDLDIGWVISRVRQGPSLTEGD
jgi:dual specificity phosphatase 3